jgi:hypothetical protein
MVRACGDGCALNENFLGRRAGRFGEVHEGVEGQVRAIGDCLESGKTE